MTVDGGSDLDSVAEVADAAEVFVVEDVGGFGPGYLVRFLNVNICSAGHEGHTRCRSCFRLFDPAVEFGQAFLDLRKILRDILPTAIGQLLTQYTRRPLYRLIPGAAADVAVDRGDSVLESQRGALTYVRATDTDWTTDTLRGADAVEAKPGQRHYETDRAKAALRAVLVDDCLLYRGKRSVGRVNAFDRDDVFPGRVGKRHQAGCHCAVSDRTVLQLADKYRTSSAVAFSTADLGPLKVFVIADEIEHRHAGRLVGGYILIVENELDH